MAVLVNHSPLTIAVGAMAFGPVVVPNSLTTLDIRLARFTTATPLFWPLDTTTIAVSVEMSYDGGQTFRLLCGMTVAGGLATEKDGSEAAETTLHFTAQRQPNRRLRLDMEVKGSVLVSELTIEAR